MEFNVKNVQTLTEKHYDLLLKADPSKNVINSYLKRSAVFEALDGDKLIGILALLPTHPKTLEIINLAVIDDYQKMGIGTELVRFAIKLATDNGYTSIEVGTGSTSFGALHLYQKCGFRMTSIDRDFFTRNYDKKLSENNLPLKDMVRLSLDIKQK